MYFVNSMYDVHCWSGLLTDWNAAGWSSYSATDSNKDLHEGSYRIHPPSVEFYSELLRLTSYQGWKDYRFLEKKFIVFL